jgi:hypothetical protein
MRRATRIPLLSTKTGAQPGLAGIKRAGINHIRQSSTVKCRNVGGERPAYPGSDREREFARTIQKGKKRDARI